MKNPEHAPRKWCFDLLKLVAVVTSLTWENWQIGGETVPTLQLKAAEYSMERKNS